MWGQKQERTPTWYGLFTEKGEESEVIDVMQYLWTGNWPDNQAPHIYSLQLEKKKAVESVYVKAGRTCKALAIVTDPDNDQLSYRWELLPEPTKVSEGGDHENRPNAMGNIFRDNGTNGMVTLMAPQIPGACRLFVYVSDGNNNVATANLPFYVTN